jgi:hypothetical protein
MTNRTSNLNLYKWDKTDSKQTTITEMAANMDVIDSSLADRTSDLQLRGINVMYPPAPLLACKGDGTSDDTNALNNLLTNYNYVFLPKATYSVSGTINVNNYNKLVGVGRGKSIIQSTNTTLPIISVSGKFTQISNLTLNRSSYSPPTNTAAVGIKLGANSFVGQSVFEQLEIVSNYRGIDADNTTNVYSCTFRDIWVYVFKDWGIALQPYGSTGCILDNIYMTNWNDYTNRTKFTATGGIIVKNYSEIDIRQLNIEHGIYNYAVYFGSCDTANIRTLHVEGYEQTGDFKSIVAVDGSQVTIDQLSVVYSSPTFDRVTFNPTGVTMWNVIGVYSGGKAYVDTLSNRNNYQVEKSTGGFQVVNTTGVTNNIAYNGDGSQTYLTSTKLNIKKHKFSTDNKFTGFSSFSNVNQRLHQIEEYNGQKYYLLQNDGTIMNYFLKTTPTAGYWKTGDRLFNVSTTPATNADLICTQGGYLSPPASGVTTTVGTSFVQDIVVSSQGNFIIGDWITIVGSSRTFQLTNIYSSGGNVHFVLSQNIEVAVTNATVQYANPIFKGLNMIAS